MNADQAKFLTEYFANMLENEGKTTAKVLAAVPDSGRNYKPDAKSRTAWDLATHLALGDIWFLDSIINGKFETEPEAEQQAAAKFKNIKEVVDHYNREFPARIKQLRALPADKLTRVVDFFGVMKSPNAGYLGLANNHSIHHRGQLAAYLRAMGGKVPSIYGGSADEPMTGAAT
ncbi:MAG: DinB family protein [Acidobacteria bacterium]|nr:DinB family protein [Acidobacteriota bacterium]